MTTCAAVEDRYMRRMQRLAIFFAVALLFSFCLKAFSKIAYNNLLPKLILQRIDSFFDLTSTQESYLQTRIAVHHEWHRTTQLKLYLADLKNLRGRFHAGLTGKDLDWLTERLTHHRNALFSRVIPDLVVVLQTLSESQITYLEKKLAKENKELAQKLARPLVVRQEEEFTTIIKYAEDWAGKLSTEQKERLRAHYMSLPDTVSDWLSYRKDQQRVFIGLLRSRPDHATLVKDLEGRMIYQERNVPQRFRAGFLRSMQLLREMILTADQLLTPEQRRNVIRKADEYIRLVEELAPKP